MISPSAISPLNRRVVDGAPFSFGNALQFDGVDDLVEINYSITGDYSISMWINYTGVNRVLFATALTTGIGLFFSSTSTYLWNVNISVSPPSPGLKHIFIKRQGSTTKYFIDNVELLNTSTLPGLNGNKNIYGFGGYNVYRYTGTINEVAIWDTALSATDIANLYNSGSGDYATNYSPANLQVYYRCNEDDGATTLIDEQGNYNGTLINFSTPPAYFIPQ